jgi:hypothetical protein
MNTKTKAKKPWYSEVEKVFFFQQLLFGLHMILVGYTTVHRANGGTLGLFVESLALCALVGNDIVDIVVHGFLRFACIDLASAWRHDGAAQRGAVRESPFLSTLIDRIVRAFGFTGPAIDAFIRDLYRHASCFLCQK